MTATGISLDEHVYVYGLMETAAGEAVSSADPSGRLAVVSAGAIAAVCEVCPDSIATVADDDDQLAALARRHDSVVHLLAGYGATLPARMGTVCVAARLLDALSASAPELSRQLGELRGCHEWRLRVTRDAPSPATPAAEDRSRRSAMSGTEYLRQRRDRRATVTDRPTAFPDLDALLAEFSAASGEVLVGAGGTTRARSYLVHDDRVDDLLACLEPLIGQATSHGEAATLAGPLPPYSFADVTLEVPQ